MPGTPEAAEAVLLAQIPETASVGKDLKAPPVSYQGTPEFQPIETTTVQRAVNTDKDIIKVGDLYYMCFQGVWFMSRTPTGPWEVTGDVPKAIYAIPVSSPSYSVTYVTVRARRRRRSCTWRHLRTRGDGRLWLRRLGHRLLLPAVRLPRGLSVYYPHYPTYGYAAAYNPGPAPTRAARWPTGRTAARARRRATTRHRRVLARRGGVRSRRRGRRGASLQPAHRRVRQTAQGANAYGSWGSTSVQRGDQWANTQRTTNNATGVTTRTTQSSAGISASVTGPGGNTTAVAKSNSGDLYAGHDGNVYKKDASGGYQKYDNGSWSSVQQPTQAQKQQAQTQASARASGAGANSATMSQVQSDAAARLRERSERIRTAGAAVGQQLSPRAEEAAGEGRRSTDTHRKRAAVVWQSLLRST